MKRRSRRKCLYCKEEFDVDVRNAKRQKCCRRTECRKAQKAERQAAWVARNPGYFSGPENVARVQAWRARNPGYWQRRGRKGHRRPRRAGKRADGRALQDAHIRQLIDPTADSGPLTPRAGALQDALSLQDPVLIDQRLVRDGHIQRCGSAALALYLFLVTVADRDGLSYYSARTIARHLSTDEESVAAARAELIERADRAGRHIALYLDRAEPADR